jgi:glycerol transport system substrate-binding protein
MRRYLLSAAAVCAVAAGQAVYADEAAALKWIDEEFQPSVLTKDEQMSEMQWFITAAEPFKGMEINVLSEGIPTHSYESEVLTKAFEEITGIKVNHQILGEGEVVQAVQTQMQTQRNLYDAYVNDSDLIGTHSRLQLAHNLTDMMAGDFKSVTNPGLDLDDFMGTQFTTSSLPTCIGSAKTGLTAPICKRPSRQNTAMIWVFRSTGLPMRTSPNSLAKT